MLKPVAARVRTLRCSVSKSIVSFGLLKTRDRTGTDVFKLGHYLGSMECRLKLPKVLGTQLPPVLLLARQFESHR